MTPSFVFSATPTFGRLGIHGGGAIEAHVAVDDVLDELTFDFGLGLVVGLKRVAEAAAGMDFVVLKDHALAGEAVLESVHGRRLFSRFTFGAG